ncbi:MAG: aldehyde dehydrogenase family protein, partial [Pseudomonadota bacterium]
MNTQIERLSPATRDFLGRDHKLFIDGRWVPPCNGGRTCVEDPSTGQVIASVPAGDDADAERAVAAAQSAFDDGRWRRLKPAERARILWRIADLIEASQSELAELEAVDAGKLHGAALSAEIPAAAETFRYYAGWCTKLEGKTFEPSIPGLDLEGRTRLEPIGVAALICPWNGPLVSASWKLAPALAAGCTCILKPSEATSLSTLFLGEILQQAGVPDGVVNIVTGGGAKVGAAL